MSGTGVEKKMYNGTNKAISKERVKRIRGRKKSWKRKRKKERQTKKERNRESAWKDEIKTHNKS